MIQTKRVFSLLVLLAAVTLQATTEERLLTEKSEDAANGGSYFAIPGMANEDSSFSSPVSFSQGILTDGKNKCGYWDAPSGAVFLCFKKPFHVSKIRVLLETNANAGTEKISLATWKEIQEAFHKNNSVQSGAVQVCKFENNFSPESVRPALEMAAKNGWNEFKIDKVSNLIMLKFNLMKGKKSIAVSKIEIWGKANGDSAQAENYDEFSRVMSDLEKAKNAISKIASLPNLAYSGSGAGGWTTLLAWPGTTAYQANCVLSQKNGDMSNDAAWAQPANYWAAPPPAAVNSDCNAPQMLVVSLPGKNDVSINRIIWYGDKDICSDYSLEYFADGRWRLLYHDKDNKNQVATYQFSPVSTDKFRLTMYKFEGQKRLLMRSFQVYNTEGNK
ncbi:MAG: hypothetical protein WC721_20960 [Victivallaceae bacterium]|jgi:hypothetical protein